MSIFSQQRPDFDTLFIFGAGGAGREIAWLADQAFGASVRVVFLVDRLNYLCAPKNGIPVQLLSDCETSPQARYIAALGDSTSRRRAVSACETVGHQATALVHPRAEMSSSVKLAKGAVVCAGSVITTNISIGSHVHVNIGCTISHDVSIGEFSTLSPGVHVSGHVRIGSDVFLGTGAIVINGKPDSPLVIGDGAIVAAGACVVDSVGAGVLVAGVPATRKR